MSAEVTIVCDGCAGIIDAAKTARAARESIRRDWAGARVGMPGGKDYCPSCVAAGHDRRAPEPDVEGEVNHGD